MRIEQSRVIELWRDQGILKKDGDRPGVASEKLGDLYEIGGESRFVEEMIDLLKRGETSRLALVQRTADEYLNGTYQVSGRDVLLKMMGEKADGQDVD